MRDTDALGGVSAPRAVRVIVGASLLLFVVQATVFAPGAIESTLGSSVHDLGSRWWTIATFTLVNQGILPLAANLSALLVFGAALERVWGTGEFVRYYAVCSLGAWIAHLVFVSPDQVLAGSAAPSIGLTLAFAAHSEAEPPLRIGAVAITAGWLAAGGTAAILAAGFFGSASAAGPAYLVHFGGFVAGWAYLRSVRSINLLRLRNAVSPVPDDLDEGLPRAVPRARPRTQRHEDDIVAQSNAAVAREASERRLVTPRTRDPKSLDRVLDKISQQGLDSLTPDERTLLDEISRRFRGR